MTPKQKLTEIVVPKEDAVFWMDRFGQWHNEGGRFEHKKIIDYFNASIRRDEQGYFVEQIRGDVHEKVYFRFEDTPLFVVEIIQGDPIRLVLNTRQTLPLSAHKLFIHEDNLYLRHGDDRIKFNDRVLLNLSSMIEHDGTNYYLRTDDGHFIIPEQGQ